MARKRILIDTCAILPAFRLKEWNRLCGHFDVETVSEVVNETQPNGINRISNYVPVDRALLAQTLKKIHPVSEDDRGALAEKFLAANLEPLEPGERDLLAHFLCHETQSPTTLLLATADRGAVRAACTMGWGDSLISLELLLRQCGAPEKALKQLEHHLTQGWLEGVRTALILGLNR